MIGNKGSFNSSALAFVFIERFCTVRVPVQAAGTWSAMTSLRETVSAMSIEG
jgi:hypothetical protein